MDIQIRPQKAQSLSDAFVKSMEKLIISGRLKTGERLPSERELAAGMNVSRPVVHEGLMKLAHLGLVTQKPRSGTQVNDYRKSGSVALLNSLLEYSSAEIEPTLLSSLLDMRELLEVEIARLAATLRSREQLFALRKQLLIERLNFRLPAEELAEADFKFHHLLAMASGNMVYPLLLNSFKSVIINLSELFYSNRKVLKEVLGYHSQLFEAVKEKDVETASETMRILIRHGREYLYRSFPSENSEYRKEEK